MATTNVARDAFEAHHGGDHAKCKSLLEQIGSGKAAQDVKVAHNGFVSDYYRSGCADPAALLQQLTQAHDRARERDKKDKGRRKKEEDEEDSYREDEDLTVLRYNQALLCMQLRQHSQAQLILEELFESIEPIDDFLAIKICFLLLELYLLLREPEQALAVLAYLEKPNAFLTVLRSERPAIKGMATTSLGDEGDEGADGAVKDKDDAADDEAAAAAEALEKPVVAAAAAEKDASAEREAPQGPLPSLTMGALLLRHGRAPDTISRAEYRFFCLMYRARLSVALRNTKAAKKDAKGALEVIEQELRHAPLLTPLPSAAGAADDGNRSADELLTEALNGQRHAMVNVLKAYLEYARQNVRKAMKLLTLCQFNLAESRALGDGQDGRDKEKATKSKRKGSEADDAEDHVPIDFHPAQDEACAPLFFNNLGCIHFMMQKPNLATYYFQKALSSKSSSTESGKMSHLLGGRGAPKLPGVVATRHWLDRRAEIAYNAGLQMLMSERPSCAFKCFEQCAPVFRTWPRLWIRLAECCIEMHRQTLTPAGGGGEATPSWCCATPRKPEACGGAKQLTWSVQGLGATRRWLLTTSRSPAVGTVGGEAGKPQAAPAAEDGGASEAAPTGDGSLVHAAMCLRNVLVLVAPTLKPVAAASGAPLKGGGKPADGLGGGAEAAPAAGGAAAIATAAGASQDKAAASGAAAGRSAKVSGAAPGGGSRHQARSLLEAEASLLEDAALVKLAYVCLFQRDYSGALRYSRRLLEKNHLVPLPSPGASAEDAEKAREGWGFQAQNLPGAPKGGGGGGGGGGSAKEKDKAKGKGEEPVEVKCPSSVGCITLATLYAAEALLVTGKSTEARALLGGFVSSGAVPKGVQAETALFSELERTSSGVHVAGRSPPEEAPATGSGDKAVAACGGLSPSSAVGGLTSPAYLALSTGANLQQAPKEREAKGEEKERASSSKDGGHAALVMYPPSEFPRLGDTQCMLYNNLAALHIQDSNLAEALKCCEKSLQVQPRALAPLRTLVYILLRKNKPSEALGRLKASRTTHGPGRPAK